jgi:hypothetical protein
MMLSPAKWWAVFIGIATVEVLLLIKLLVYRSSTDLLVSICAIAVLLILTLRVQDLESISFDKNGIQAKLRYLEAGLSEAQAEIEANKEKIDNLFLLSMGPALYTNLKKIASGHFGKYHKPNDGGLEHELRHLRNIGYIEIKDNSISKIPEYGEKLSEYVWATETGKDFVTLRELIEQRKSQGAG